MRKIIEFIIAFLFGKKDEIVRKEYVEYIVKDYDIKLYQEINAYRQSLGLSFLEYGCEDCFNIVGEHAFWMAENIKTYEEFEIKGHYFTDDRFEQLELRLGSNLKAGENLARGYINPKSAVSKWSKSSGHKETLEGDYTHVVMASKNKLVIAIFYKDGK